MRQTKQIQLAAHATGRLAENNFKVAYAELRPLGQGESLCENIYLTIDPAMSRRCRSQTANLQQLPIGGVVPSYAVGRVIEANGGPFEVGDYIAHYCGGWESHTLIPVADDSLGPFRLQKADPTVAAITSYITALGSKGFTGYLAIEVVAKVQAGETVLISGAAGGVGGYAGQLAKLAGARVVGLAGSPAKCEVVVRDLGFDACVSYRDDTLGHALDEACPDGIDVYLDNVGGDLQDVVMNRMNPNGRFIISGMVAEYETDAVVRGPNLFITVTRNFRIEGFQNFRFQHLYPAFRERMAALLKSGAVVAKIDVGEDIEGAPKALVDLMAGGNMGSKLMRIAPDPTAA